MSSASRKALRGLDLLPSPSGSELKQTTLTVLPAQNRRVLPDTSNKASSTKRLLGLMRTPPGTPWPRLPSREPPAARSPHWLEEHVGAGRCSTWVPGVPEIDDTGN